MRTPPDRGPVRRARLALVAAVGLGITTGARAHDRSLLAFSAGQYNIADQAHAAAEVGVQWRGAGRWWVLHPMAGGAITHQGAVNLYLGFTFDLPIGKRFAFRPSFAPGFYRRGNGKDLGYPFEFRSGLEAGWRFARGTRLGGGDVPSVERESRRPQPRRERARVDARGPDQGAVRTLTGRSGGPLPNHFNRLFRCYS